jgi:hypothetical protein
LEDARPLCCPLFLFGLVSSLVIPPKAGLFCLIGTGVAFRFLRYIRLVLFAGRLIAESTKPAPGEFHAGISRNRKLWLLVPTLVVHHDNSLRRFYRIGTDKPTTILKKNNPAFFFTSLRYAFGCFALRNWFGRNNICFLSRFSNTLAFGNAQQGHRYFHNNSDWDSETSSGGREKG